MSQTILFSNAPVKASEIIGTSVFNRIGANLGTIKEVVLDLHHGQVAYVVVSFGGFLGMGQKLFAIPFSSFEYNTVQGECILDIPKERLEKAPGFDADAWPRLSDEKWNREIYTYYDRPPYWD